MKGTIFAAVALLALATGSSPAATNTISGTLVNVADYVTGNSGAVSYGMGAMMAGYGGMNGGSMMGGGSNGSQWMHACAGSVGLLTKDGQLYLLVVQPGSGALYSGYGLCSRIGSSATVRGETFERGGVRVLEVESLQEH